jgi:hypothetical protein
VFDDQAGIALMVRYTWSLTLVGIVLLVNSTRVDGGIIEVGDLNIINDAGNPSNGLAFLDLSFSDGRTLADALANAQLTYADARKATPSEWNDLFAAAGIGYDSISYHASDGFATGVNLTLSSGANYDGGALSGQLGVTDGGTGSYIWTDPDGSTNTSTTRDFIALRSGTNLAYANQIGQAPPHNSFAWLLVSNSAAAVPEPSSLTMASVITVGALYLRRRRRKRNLINAAS